LTWIAQSCGDQNVILGLREVHTLQELCAFTLSLSPQTLTSVVTPHAKGLGLIAAVRGREETLNVPVDAAMKARSTLLAISIATSSSTLVRCLDHCKCPCLKRPRYSGVTTPEVLAINQTMRFVGEMMAATLPGDMIQFVVKQWGPGALAPDAIEQTFRRKLAPIPQDDITAAVQCRDPCHLW